MSIGTTTSASTGPSSALLWPRTRAGTTSWYQRIRYRYFLNQFQIFGNLVKVNKFHPQDLAVISSLSEDSAILAPWDVCSLGDERVVNGVADELATVKEVRDSNTLILKFYRYF